MEAIIKGERGWRPSLKGRGDGGSSLKGRGNGGKPHSCISLSNVTDSLV